MRCLFESESIGPRKAKQVERYALAVPFELLPGILDVHFHCPNSCGFTHRTCIHCNWLLILAALHCTDAAARRNTADCRHWNPKSFSGRISLGVRNDVDLRRSADRLLEKDIRVCPRSALARSRPTLSHSSAQLLCVVRVIQRTRSHQSPLRA